MAIKSYTKNGETLYRVRVQIQSGRFPSIRVNEQISRIKSEAEALRAEAKLRKDVEKKVLEQEMRRSVTGQTWRGVLDHWYDTQNEVRVKFGSISQYVLDDYFNCVKKWMAMFEYTPCADIRPIDLMQLFNTMAEQGLSLAYRRKMRTLIKSIFDHGMQNGLVNMTRNPVHDLFLKDLKRKNLKSSPLVKSEDWLKPLLHKSMSGDTYGH